MNPALPELSPGAVRRVCERASDLGVLVAGATADGALQALPGATEAPDCLRTSAALRSAIARAWPRLHEGETVDVMDGLVCLALGRAEHFDGAAICLIAVEGFDDAASLGGTMRLRADRCGAADVAVAMRWLAEGEAAAESSQDAVAQAFTDELSSTYEQISVVYQLVRSMNGVDDPQRIVALTCGQLLEALGFTWFVACFDDRPEISATLRGAFIPIGDLPCDADELHRHVSALVREQRADRWSCVLTTDDSEFARRVGYEILFESVAHDGTAIGALFCGGRAGHDADISSVDIKLVDAAADFLGVFHENACRFQEQREMFFGTLYAMTGSVDAKDPYTHGHSERVAHLSHALAVAAGANEDEAERVRIAGLLHDVGKIGVPERVLLKAGRLDDDEFDALKRHPVIGHEILRGIRPMAPMLPGVLHHHERWDGRGYPHGLAGEAIPWIARVLALADAFDAMSSNRAYRDAMPRAKVLEEITRCAGSQFDPELAPLFVAMDFSRYDEMVAQAKPQAKAA